MPELEPTAVPESLEKPVSKKRKKKSFRTMLATAEPEAPVDPYAELTMADLDNCVRRRNPLNPGTVKILRVYFANRNNPAARIAIQARHLQVTANKVLDMEQCCLQLLARHTKG